MTRWLIRLAVCAALIAATWWCLRQDRPAPIVAAEPVPACTVYIERYWGMTFWETKPGGRLVIEFAPVKHARREVQPGQGGKSGK